MIEQYRELIFLGIIAFIFLIKNLFSGNNITPYSSPKNVISYYIFLKLLPLLLFFFFLFFSIKIWFVYSCLYILIYLLLKYVMR